MKISINKNIIKIHVQLFINNENYYLFITIIKVFSNTRNAKLKITEIFFVKILLIKIKIS